MGSILKFVQNSLFFCLAVSFALPNSVVGAPKDIARGNRQYRTPCYCYGHDYAKNGKLHRRSQKDGEATTSTGTYVYNDYYDCNDYPYYCETGSYTDEETEDCDKYDLEYNYPYYCETEPYIMDTTESVPTTTSPVTIPPSVIGANNYPDITIINNICRTNEMIWICNKPSYVFPAPGPYPHYASQAKQNIEPNRNDLHELGIPPEEEKHLVF